MKKTMLLVAMLLVSAVPALAQVSDPEEPNSGLTLEELARIQRGQDLPEVPTVQYRSDTPASKAPSDDPAGNYQLVGDCYFDATDPDNWTIVGEHSNIPISESPCGDIVS